MIAGSLEISVVIPAYKAEAFIARAIASVLEQPNVHREIIVIVDGVFDQTAEIAGRFPGVTVLVNEANQGAPKARNRGLSAASAPFVLFLDADDYLEGPLLSSLLGTARKDGVDIVFSPTLREWSDGRREVVKQPIFYARLELIREWLDGRFVPPCSILWNAAFVRGIGGWREGLVRNQDGELVWRALLAGARAGYADRGAGIYVQHDGPERISSQRSIEAQRADLELGDWLGAELRARDELTEPLRQALVSFFYRGMRQSCLRGVPRIAEEFEARWRALGGSRHEGTVAHRLTCNLLGLRRKEQISARLNSGLDLSRRILRRADLTGRKSAQRTDEKIRAAGRNERTHPVR